MSSEKENSNNHAEKHLGQKWLKKRVSRPPSVSKRKKADTPARHFGIKRRREKEAGSIQEAPHQLLVFLMAPGIEDGGLRFSHLTILVAAVAICLVAIFAQSIWGLAVAAALGARQITYILKKRHESGQVPEVD